MTARWPGDSRLFTPPKVLLGQVIISAVSCAARIAQGRRSACGRGCV